MANPFLGEIRMFGGTFAPRGWAFCNGQLLAISQNDALFALLGTIYGGDGVTTFALPDLRGRIPLHNGQGSGLSPYTQGQVAGTESVTLTSNNVPQHSHLVAIGSATTNAPAGNTFGGGGVAAYKAPPPTGTMAAIVSPTTASQPHDNMMPGLAVSFIIALEG